MYKITSKKRIFLFFLLLFLSYFSLKSQDRRDDEIARLRRKISELQEEKSEMAKFTQYLTSLVLDVKEGLFSIDIGLVAPGKTEVERQRDLREKLLDRIDLISKQMNDYKDLVRELHISQEQIEKFEKIVFQLQEELEKKKQEILILNGQIISLERKNLAIERKSFEDYKKHFEENKDLKGKLDVLRKEFEDEKEKAAKKYYLEITPKSLMFEECYSKNVPIEIRGKNIRVLTGHQRHSFEFKKIGRRHYTLEIFNWDSFWGTKKFLVIYHK